MEAVGLAFRATKDLDVVIFVEGIDREFAAAIHAFITAGGYTVLERETEKRRFHRFAKPTAAGYPAMLELFSRADGALEIAPEQRTAPIFRAAAAQGETLSLSAILLDDVYYGWIRSGRIRIEGLPIVRAEHLIPLKARAWLDLTARRDAGERIDSHDIAKHKNDVFRLYRILDPEYAVATPPEISADVSAFIDRMGSETLDFKALEIRSSAPDVFAELRRRYARQG
ncbi:MAG: hypothetical protein H0X45_08110 [Planctomycetes bacterium]|nr:hypothetical protein [Planctomycetota bacterium]